MDAQQPIFETRKGHSFGELRIHANGGSATDGGASPVQVRVPLGAGVVARQHPGGHPRQPRTPQPACPSVTIPLRPVFFSSTQGGPVTGATLQARLAAANAIWGKCGIAFTTARARTVVDPAHGTAGTTPRELIAFQLRHETSGTGPEVFFVDHDLPYIGGGGTHGRGDDAKIMISDRGANDRLLAHELGHAMGYEDWIHFAPYARGTIMEPSRSNNDLNSDVVTSIICTMLAWPPNRSSSCDRPDPNPVNPAPPPPATTAE